MAHVPYLRKTNALAHVPPYMRYRCDTCVIAAEPNKLKPVIAVQSLSHDTRCPASTFFTY